MNELKFTFLTKEQIFGANQLDVLKKYGTKCVVTNFVTLLGGETSPGITIYDNGIEKRCGEWLTKSAVKSDWDEVYCVSSVTSTGETVSEFPDMRYGAARPALSYSSLLPFVQNQVRLENGILEVEYGEYPQDIVANDFSKTLDELYANGMMNKTEKTYTTDSVTGVYEDYQPPFQAMEHTEYEYNGKKYIRFVARENNDVLNIKKGISYWVEVKPIKWLVDEKENIAVSKYAIFSGIQFDIVEDYKCDFENTNIHKFMNEIFAKDIIPSVINKTIEIDENDQIKLRIQSLKELSQEYGKATIEQMDLLAKGAKLDSQVQQQVSKIAGENSNVK